MPYESAYSLGLIKFLKGGVEEAAGIVRKAVILQPYVPEIILFRTAYVNYSWNFPENEGMYSNAHTYCNIYLGHKIWSEDPESLAFLDWLYSCPDMLAERAKSLSLLNRMLYLSPDQTEEADHLRNEFLRFATTPNPALIARILRKIPRGPNLIDPWELCIWSEPVNGVMDELFGDLGMQEGDAPAEPDYPSGETGFADGWEGFPDCGDCDECEIFDECANSPSINYESCKECEECEIEGFCQNEDNSPPMLKDKKPPVRH